MPPSSSKKPNVALLSDSEIAAQRTAGSMSDDLQDASFLQRFGILKSQNFESKSNQNQSNIKSTSIKFKFKLNLNLTPAKKQRI